MGKILAIWIYFCSYCQLGLVKLHNKYINQLERADFYHSRLFN